MREFGFLILFGIALNSCKSDTAFLMYNVEGETQGTTYHISWYDSTDQTQELLRLKIDEVFLHVDSTFSSYLGSSLVSRFNASTDSAKVNDDFIRLFNLSYEIHQLVGGAFDPTVGPLINAYGFGPEGLKAKASDDSISSLMSLVGMHHVRIQGEYLIKDTSKIRLDFNAIAQGFTVDLIAKVFNENGIQSYLIEVGGELIAKGMKLNNQNWIVGIDKPIEDAVERELLFNLPLHDKSIATSGNYRKYYVENGRKVTHTIDPVTGKSVTHHLLSASIISDTCAVADALATAMMVMGKEKSIEFLEKNRKYKGILIFENENGELEYYISPEIEKMVVKLN